MAINDVYQVRLQGTYQGVSWANVWYFVQQAGAANSATNLATRFQTQDLDPISDFQNSTVNYTDLSVINYRNPLDSVLVVPTITAGQRVGTSNPAPTFLAGGIRFYRNGPGTRYPYKRLVGLLEEDFNANALEPAAVALLVAAGTAMVLNHVQGADTWRYVQITGTPVLGVNPTIKFIVPGFVPTVYLATQNTRKD